MLRHIGLLGGLFVFAMVFLAVNALSRAQTVADYDLTDYRATMIRLLGSTVDSRTLGINDFSIFDAVENSSDPLYIAPLVDLAYFSRSGETAAAIFDALEKLTGQAFGTDWRAYLNWAAANDVDLPPGYDEFKGLMFSTFVDPEFARFFQPGVMDTARVNLIEAVWGGVRVDGIPSLVNARQISPQEALDEGESFQAFCREGDCRYPASDEYVFGISINGDNRAYPLRLLNWHEMFNDVIGHTPMYDQPDGEIVCHFRAPTPFQVTARWESTWVQISGESAGCPDEGWLKPGQLLWSEEQDWQTVQESLPDMSQPNTSPLDAGAGVEGRVQGMPVMLAYCTLCGSGILYDSTIPDLIVDGKSLGETTLEFGSTGMLMRSNKLMYDRKTDTVWNAMTGEPAFGPLTASDVRLEILPVVVTDWAAWVQEHPDTSVLSLQTGYQRNYTNGAAYSDYFNDPDFIMFPVWQQDTRQQENKDMVFAINLNDSPKAYPLSLIVPQQVTNDTHAGVNLVIVAREAPEREFFEPGGAAVRAYQRDDHQFSPGNTSGEIKDENGAIWTITEEALVNNEGMRLERLSGHLAFWFGWYSFYPDTQVYTPAQE